MVELANHDAPRDERPLVVDLEKLFRYSSMTDVLRDEAKTLLRTGASAQTRAQMVGQYHQLRAELAGCLRDDLGGELRTYAPDLRPDAPVDQIFVSAASMARWVDSVLQTPGFLIHQRLSAQNAREITGKLDSGKPLGEAATGTYL